MTITLDGIAQLLLWLVLLLATVRPLGGYMQRGFAGDATILSPLLRPTETTLYRMTGVRPGQPQEWRSYALTFLAYHLPVLLLLYDLLERNSAAPSILHAVRVMLGRMTGGFADIHPVRSARQKIKRASRNSPLLRSARGTGCNMFVSQCWSSCPFGTAHDGRTAPPGRAYPISGRCEEPCKQRNLALPLTR